MTRPSDATASEGKPAVICPKCGSQMLPVPRFGVEIDQCTGCNGLFLDRGELEALSQAEANFYAAAQPPPPQQYIPSQPYSQQGGYPQQGGFLGGLFGGGHHGRYGHH
ncbi:MULTISPECIES: TFIIB-type zinc ribbon-containing protein [Mycobacterium]|nr:zf-TFIIB domain-containing protein [Mycobacterium marinum]BDE15720.1 hypothetical protein MKCMC460_45800 [Mycobacterium sp. 20KCMC460]GLB87376.1 hypothetical protein SRL2020130_01930 [Mycobacterium kiyosense]GLB99574.1 hypothetical protein SRL2020400_01660 [Mycobacterium kiyosense]GLC06493.1 hypothetical protein SRL2020411_11390 [Mycobacterium kiyosense]GLC11590.1 hypothetical protein SRL2020448_01930 [Mycobacterium kiyosense]